MSKPALKVFLAAPRGFCAGVVRAIAIVEKALEKYGAPVYVRHEIVHNKYVLEQLSAKGAVFVESLDQVPAEAPVIFSAHGVPKSVNAAAERRKMIYLDATCPLVSKVHREAERLFEKGCKILLIGHAGHPEVIGTMGQLPAGAIILIETAQQARDLKIETQKSLAYITQTTLSVDDTAEIIKILKQRFPNIQSPKKEDICYATTNRQAAVKEIAPKVQMLMVIGAPNSSNSLRLVETAKAAGCAQALLIQRARDIDFKALHNIKTLGITAGASAPETLIDEVLKALSDHFTLSIEQNFDRAENVVFNLPRTLIA